MNAAIKTSCRKKNIELRACMERKILRKPKPVSKKIFSLIIRQYQLMILDIVVN